MGAGAATPPPGSAFAEEATPVGQLAGGVSSSAGAALGASGGLASVNAGAASNLAATPEPASFALIATGLLGIAGLIRRRRA